MPELSKHELDKLFQRGSEQYDFEYNPAAWGQMAAMLDRRRRRRMLAWWAVGLALLFLLLGLGFCFFYHKAEGSRKNKNQEPAQIEASRPASENIHPEKGKQEANPLDVLPAKPGIKQAAPVQDAAPSGKEGKPGPQAVRRPPASADIAVKKSEGLPSATGPIALEREKETGMQNNDSDGPANRKMPGAQEPLTPLPGRFSFLDAAPEGRDTPAVGSWQPQKQGHKHSNHLAVGLSGSTGLNSIGWGGFSKPGWRAGVVAEYQYNKHFGLELGALFLRANYVAGKGEYIPPKGFWTRRIAPDNTRGLCNILEIPVSLKYYPGSYSRSGIFASAGFSSYFMLMEEYWYHYSLEEPDLIRWWQTKETHSYWFAIGQISAGYQARLGNRWAFQLAPYLQAPLSGVGHGQVKLYSLGAHARLHWRVW